MGADKKVPKMGRDGSPRRRSGDSGPGINADASERRPYLLKPALALPRKSGDGVRKVALLIETSNRYGRDLLYGVRDWMREGERWAIRFTEQGRRAPLPTWLKDWRGDGIIARVDSPQIAAALRNFTMETGLVVSRTQWLVTEAVDERGETAAVTYYRMRSDVATN
jgi:hypothetical protein